MKIHGAKVTDMVVDETMDTVNYQMTITGNLVTTVLGLAEAWARKGKAIATTLRYAEKAPALFKPVYIAELIAELRTAMTWATYWRGQLPTREVA
jgi:hypothetical protein